MSTKTKLILSIISSIVVFLMISFGVTAVLTKKVYYWNSNVEVVNEGDGLTYDISGAINGTNSFAAKSQSGSVDNPVWEIAREDTTFVSKDTPIEISFTFTNKSNETLRIVISGIHIDAMNRFSTQVFDTTTADEEIGITVVNNKGSVEAIIAPQTTENNSKTLTLRYTLIKTNLNIEGNENDTQNLLIKLSKDVD